MMKFMDELEAMMLTVKLNVLCEKSKRISGIIGDLPIIFFPDQQKELIDMAEEEYELTTRLYQIYIDNQEFDRAALAINAEKDIEMSLFLLKKDLVMV